MSCEVFRDLWEREDRETKSRYLYTSRAFGVCVIIVQNVIKIYINKEKIPLSHSSLVVVVSRRAFSLSRR